MRISAFRQATFLNPNDPSTASQLADRMKTRLLTLSLICLLAVGCNWKGIRGNGVIKSDVRTVAAFSKIDAGGYYQLEWQPGPPSLTVTTDENLLNHVTTRVEGEQLKIGLDGAIAPSEGIKVVVTSPELTTVELSGAVEFTAKPLAGAKFSLDTSGAAKVTLAGKVNRLLANLTGASKLVAADLQAEDVELSVTGAGKADITATNSLKAAITGAGKVVYGGSPKSVDRNVTGAGKIEPRDQQ